MSAVDLKGLSRERRQRLMLAGGVLAVAFVVELATGLLAGSQALRADSLDFAAVALGLGASFWRPRQNRDVQVLARLGEAALLVLLGVAVGFSTFHAFFVREMPEPSLMAAGALVALTANGSVLYLLRAERTAGALHGTWLTARNDMVGSAAVLIAAGVVALVDNGVADLTVAGVIVVLFLMQAIGALRQAARDWEAVRTADAPKTEGS